MLSFRFSINIIFYSPFSATPVAVPHRRRGFSECSRGIRSSLDSLSTSPKYTDYLQQKAATLTPTEEIGRYLGRGKQLPEILIKESELISSFCFTSVKVFRDFTLTCEIDKSNYKYLNPFN